MLNRGCLALPQTSALLWFIFVDAAVARAFVRYYAEKLKVRPPEKGAEGYCAAIGQWLGEIDVFREAACVESSELIGRLGGSDGEYWAWVWEEGHFFVRTPGTNEMGIRYINELWVMQPREARRRHPLAPIVEAWVRFATDGPPSEEWY